MKIITKEEAIALGKKRYFTGKPCKYGHIAERLVSNKTCCDCLRIKKAEAYRNNPKKHNLRALAWQRNNKEKRRSISKAYYLRHYAANRARLTEHTRRYRAQDPEKYRASARRSYEKDRDRQLTRMREYRLLNKDKMREMTRKWRSGNPDKVAQMHRNRYAREKGAVGQYTVEHVEAMLKTQAGSCAACSSDIRDSYEVDHIMPLSLGGTNHPDNLQLLCKPCNASKGAKHPAEWKGRQQQ